MQSNWIGKSIGAEIDFYISESETKIKIFTTRPDTIYGATFLAVSSEHELVTKISKNNIDLEKFINTKVMSLQKLPLKPLLSIQKISGAKGI